MVFTFMKSKVQFTFTFSAIIPAKAKYIEKS